MKLKLGLSILKDRKFLIFMAIVVAYIIVIRIISII